MKRVGQISFPHAGFYEDADKHFKKNYPKNYRRSGSVIDEVAAQEYSFFAHQHRFSKRRSELSKVRTCVSEGARKDEVNLARSDQLITVGDFELCAHAKNVRKGLGRAH